MTLSRLWLVLALSATLTACACSDAPPAAKLLGCVADQSLLSLTCGTFCLPDGYGFGTTEGACEWMAACVDLRPGDLVSIARLGHLPQLDLYDLLVNEYSCDVPAPADGGMYL